MLPLTDAALWSAFEHRTLPAPEWRHATHVRVAFLHLERFDLDEAHLRMRAGIILLNAVHGLVETPARGYHETLTRVWLALVASARAGDAARGVAIPDSGAFWEAHEAELGAAAPLRFYSREVLFSPRARSIFVPPDVAALPA